MPLKLSLREMKCLARISELGWGDGICTILSHWHVHDLSTTMEVVSHYHGGCLPVSVRNKSGKKEKQPDLQHLKGLYTTRKFSQYVFLQNTENECLLGHVFSLLNTLLHQKPCGARRGKNGALETLILVTYIVTYTLVVTQGSPPSNPSLIPKLVAA